MEHYSHSVPGWFDPEDFEFYDWVVLELARRLGRVRHVVEIGSFKGRSSSRMAVNLINLGQHTQFDCIDTWLGSIEHQAGQPWADPDVIAGKLFDRFRENMAPVSGYYRAVCLDSVSAAELYDPGSLDLVFIDADHGYDSVYEDIRAWRSKIRSGGVIAGHDWPYSTGLRRAVRELLGEPIVSGTCWYFWL